MADEDVVIDWLGDIRALNRLFLTYLATLARAEQPCLNLPRHVARQLRDVGPDVLDRIADLPTALFHLDFESHWVDRRLPRNHLEQARWSLSLTILSSAWHMTRSNPFEARMFLHLSRDSLKRLRATRVSELATLARLPSVLRCAFADTAFMWPALVRIAQPDDERMLTLITLQPELAGTDTARRPATVRRSFS